MLLAPGTRLGPYEVTAQIGAGGMGEVYKARDTRLDRSVAIKVLSSQLADRDDWRRRLEREARAVSRLNHPRICTLYDIGREKVSSESDDAVIFLVMEYLEGETLAERIIRGPLAIDDALRYGSQIAEALGEAHAHGLVHRDLKPANVVLTRSGAKLLDFGIAKMGHDWLESSTADTVGPLTRRDEIVGTPQYMAPEQLEGKPSTPATDVFAFGALLYEMLTGRRAFDGGSRAAVAAMVIMGQPTSLSSARPAIPGSLETIVMRCLAKEPAARWQRADELVTVLGAEMSGRAGSNPKPAVRSLAVLPLENLSRDPEQEYFADGMTDTLITTLAQLAALRVISRTSVMRYKGARKPLPEIARELNVDTVIEGTVLRSGERVRIGAQLIDAASDTHLWAKNYESDVSDILSMQNDVARAIANEVQIQLTPQEQARLQHARRVNPEAYEAFLKGRHHWYRRSPGSLDRALASLQQAVDIDPTYALGLAGLADAYISLGWDLFAMRSPDDTYPRAKAMATQALAHDPDCAEAHAARGWAAAGYDWNWAAAEADLCRAIALKPQYAPVHIWYSHLLQAMGRTSESLHESHVALSCDPLGLILNVHLGWHHLYVRQYQPAIDQLLKTIDLDPDFILARMFLGEAYEHVGRLEDAITEFRRAVDLSGRRPIYLAGLGHAYAISGHHDEAVTTVAELEQRAAREFVSARGVAEIYLGLGERDTAFSWLGKAFDQRSGWLMHIQENPRYDGVRDDPRYAALLRRLNLPR